MKNSSKLLSTLVTAAALSALTAGAQDWQSKIYGKVDAGGSWVQDTEIKEVFGPAVPGGKMKFDPGFRAGVGVGYDVTDWFAGELEMGFMANNVKEFAGASSFDAELYNVPFLVNAKLQLPNKTICTPYIGAGIGGTGTMLDIGHLDYGYPHVSGTAADFVFSYQAFAGLRFDLSDHMSLGVEYRYVHSDAPDFEAESGDFWYISSEHLKIGALDTQSVSLMFRVSF